MDSEMKLHNSKKDNTMTKKKKGTKKKSNVDKPLYRKRNI